MGAAEAMLELCRGQRHAARTARGTCHAPDPVKPVVLLADAIKDCSWRNGIVLDPFLGSGTSLIAAERTGRRARGIEIDPVYVDVAIQRWQTYTRQERRIGGDGPDL